MHGVRLCVDVSFALLPNLTGEIVAALQMGGMTTVKIRQIAHDGTYNASFRSPFGHVAIGRLCLWSVEHWFPAFCLNVRRGNRIVVQCGLQRPTPLR